MSLQDTYTSTPTHMFSPTLPKKKILSNPIRCCAGQSLFVALHLPFTLLTLLWVPVWTVRITQHLTRTWFRWDLGLLNWWYWDEILDLIYCTHINCSPLPNCCGWVQSVGGPGRREGRRRVRSGHLFLLLSPCRTEGLAVAVPLCLESQNLACRDTPCPQLQLFPGLPALCLFQVLSSGTASH